MRANKTHVDVVAKRSLSGHLRDPEKYIPLIERRVDYTSKLQQLASLLVNHFLVHQLNNGEIQFLDQLHIVSGAGSGLLKGIFRTAMLLFTTNNRAPHPNAPASAQQLKDLYLANYAERFDKLPKLAYFGKALEDYAAAMATAFRNSLQHSFEARLRNSIRFELASRGLEFGGDEVSKVFRAITVPNAAPEHPEALNDYVHRTKRILYNREMDVADVDDGEFPDDIGRINEDWLADPRNHVGILFFYHFALRRMTDLDADMAFAGRRFTLSPIYHTYAHHAIVDHECLYGMMIEAGDIPKKSLKNFKSEANMHWDSVFKLDKLRASGQVKNCWNFTFLVKTDGTAASFHYMRPWRPEDDPNYRHAMPGGDGDADGYHWGVDPGHQNILFAARRCDDGSFHTERLTKNQYYGQTGFDKGRRQRANWNKRELADEAGAFDGTVLKTTDEDKIAEYTAAMARVFVQSWRVKTSRKRRQLRYRCHLGRRRVLDKFFNRLQGPDGSAPRIAFGDAKFCSSHKGWGRSAPTTSVRAACHRRFPLTADVDEFRTSSVCPTCDAQLTEVICARTNQSVRGFRRCPSPECAARAFLSRDAVGAINILRCHEAALEARPRPGFLRRGAQDGWVRPYPRFHL